MTAYHLDPTYPRITVEDNRVTLVVLVDWADGRGPVLSLSVPSGRMAGYPEARARGYAAAREKVAEKVAELRNLYPNGIYVPTV